MNERKLTRAIILQMQKEKVLRRLAARQARRKVATKQSYRPEHTFRSTNTDHTRSIVPKTNNTDNDTLMQVAVMSAITSSIDSISSL